MDNTILELEKQCLDAVQYNFPLLKQCNGELVFIAEADSEQLTATAWQFDPQTQALLKQYGVKNALLEMLDTLVAERKHKRIKPNREGRLIIQNGNVELQWLQLGEAGLATYKYA